MRILNINENQNISGGVLYYNGYTKTVPPEGIPPVHYQVIDSAMNQLLNDKITAYQFFATIESIPQSSFEAYVKNQNSVQWY